MVIMSEEARIRRIAEAVAAHPPGGERVSLPWQGTPTVLPVVSIELGALVLNPNSHRIRAQLESHPNRQLVKDSPFTEEAQDIIAELLEKTEGFEALKNNLQEERQTHPGVITHKGLLVNGNTRLVALRDLGQDYIRVAVLPSDATELAMTELELRLQMQIELKQEYTFTNELLFVEELISMYNRSPEEIALNLRWAASRDSRELQKGKAKVEQAVRLLGIIRDLQDRSRNKVPLADFDEKRQALFEIDEAYQELVGRDPERARKVRDTRLIGVLVGVGYRELRYVDGDFLPDYLVPAMEESDLLGEHVTVLTSGRPPSDDVVPGLDVLPAPDSDAEEEPDPAPMLELLAASRADTSVEIAGDDGPVIVQREPLVDSVRTAMESAAEEARADRKEESRLEAPIELLKEGERKLRKSLGAYERVRGADEFDLGKFAYSVRKVGRTVDELKAAIEKPR